MLAMQSTHSAYRPLSRYPSIDRDTCFEVPEDVTYEVLVQAFTEAFGEPEVELGIEPVDIYQGDASVRRITLRARLTPHTATMTSDVANDIVDTAARIVADKLGLAII